MRELTPDPLTAEAFAPFGRVIEAGEAAVKVDINEGHAVRYDALAEVDVADGGGRPVISLFRARRLEEAVVNPVVQPCAGGGSGDLEPALDVRRSELHVSRSSLERREQEARERARGHHHPTEIAVSRMNRDTARHIASNPVGPKPAPHESMSSRG